MTPERYECPDCEVIFVNARQCPSCGWKVASRPDRPILPAVRPCTREQNLQALAILHAVLARQINLDEGRRRLAELFGADVVMG
jgi:hypothetical protein